MKKQIEELRIEFQKQLEEISDKRALNDLRVAYLGKKGQVSALLKGMKDLANEAKKEAGAVINILKKDVEEAIKTHFTSLEQQELHERLQKEWHDITWPEKNSVGSIHLLETAMRNLERLFTSMGFDILNGPEMEDEKYNFTLLNIPDDHPARDTQDTFWLSNGKLLRTHTSPVQLRGMLAHKPPFKFVAPGRTYRNEAIDATHEHSFHQIEGMVVDKNITVANLIFTLKQIISYIFENDVEVRLRPSYFPFVEPGFELDFQCQLCHGKGCKVCKQTGWVEYLGCGMIHPNVLRNGGIDPEIYSGFAFGGGVERLIMMKYSIDDIRHFTAGDIRFLSQF